MRSGELVRAFEPGATANDVASIAAILGVLVSVSLSNDTYVLRGSNEQVPEWQVTLARDGGSGAELRMRLVARSLMRQQGQTRLEVALQGVVRG